MPLIIKVSVSRKLTEDFNSRGWCLDLQSEFDPRTFDDTDALANSTNHLFALANNLLDEQVQQASEGHQTNGTGQHRPAYNGSNGNGQNGHGANRISNNGAYSRQANRNGNRGGGSPKSNNGRTERPITQAQINAIQKMAQRYDTHGDAIAGEDFNCKLSELTIRQASELIDRLKKGLEAQGGKEAGR